MELDRRAFLAALAAAGAGVALPARASGLSPSSTPSPLVPNLSLIFDSFGSPQLGTVETGGRGILSGHGRTAVHVGLPGQSFSVARRSLAEWDRRFLGQPDQLFKIEAPGDIERSAKQGTLGLLLGFSGAACLDDNVDNVYALYGAGARVIQLNDQRGNLPGSSHDGAAKAGLSDLGVGIVETMNELGMVVDLSHCTEAASRQGIQISRKPPAYTHISCRALRSERQSKSDELLRAMAERGGMIGVHPGDDRSSEAHLDHITHAVDVAGIDHVGIASSRGPSGPRSQVSFLTLAHGLERRRYRSGDIEKLLGGNWDRYLREAL